MDIYIVVDCGRVVGASAKLQGAELIRHNEAERLAQANTHHPTTSRETFARRAYDRMHIENHELHDTDQ